jgi:hypothetical protein
VTSYEDVAAVLSVDLCAECEFFPIKGHRAGAASGNTIHWAPRRMTRRGLRQFLMLVAEIRVLNFRRLNAAMRVYTRNVWAANAGKLFHVRFPRSYSRVDRYLIRWLISQGAAVSDAAQRWAYRKEITRG